MYKLLLKNVLLNIYYSFVAKNETVQVNVAVL